MKFPGNSYYAIALLISLVSLMSDAPRLQAQENQDLIFQPTFETSNELELEATQAPILQPSWEIPNNFDQQEWLSQIEKIQAQTTQPTLDIDNVEQEDWPSPIKDEQIFWLLLIDQLEYRINEGADSFNWDAIGWVGGDYRRFWLKTEGEVGFSEGEGEAEIQALYGQLITPFFDFQAGLRYERLYGSGEDSDRFFAVVGVQGLAPYLFEVDASLFLSEAGDVSARLAAEYQLLLTQRLILQPELEVNLAVQEVEEFGVGSGLNDLELGLRLRYEISRRFAPYVGVSWTRQFGETADFTRDEGEETDNFAVVGGLRLLF